MLNLLLKLLPRHRYYLEAFGGSATLLFAKKRAEFEVYNDIDSNLVNFFRVLRDKPKELWRKLWLTPFSHEEYKYCSENYKNAEDPVEKARMFFVAVKQAFGGRLTAKSWVVEKFGHSGSGKHNSAEIYKNTIKELLIYAKRLQGIFIENKDWREILDYYNDWEKEGVFYLDPPYYPSVKKLQNDYEYTMTEQDHEELIDWCLNKAKVNVMLSGYPNELYNELDKAGWKRYCKKIPCFAKATTYNSNFIGEGVYNEEDYRTDCVWVNYISEFELPTLFPLDNLE